MKKMTAKTLIFIILCFTIVTACTLCLSNPENDVLTDIQVASFNGDIFGEEDLESIIQDLLCVYPINLMPQKAATAGCFVIVHGVVEGDSKKAWDAFYANVSQGKDAAVIIVQYTIEGDPILNYISFKNGSFFSVTDTSRDAWDGSDPYYPHYSDSYKFLNQFETEGYTTVILSDIHYDTFEGYENDTDTNRDKSVYLFSVWNS